MCAYYVGQELKNGKSGQQPDYLKNIMKKVMATMDELSMAIMSQSKMHKDVEKYVVDSMAFSAQNMKQIEHRLDEAKAQAQHYYAQLQKELQNKG